MNKDTEATSVDEWIKFDVVGIKDAIKEVTNNLFANVDFTGINPRVHKGSLRPALNKLNDIVNHIDRLLHKEPK